MTSTITLMQGDTDTRNFVLSDANGAVNLSKYYPNILFCIDDNSGHYFEITCDRQASSYVNYKSLYDGGIAVKFTSTHLAVAGDYNGQFVLTDVTGDITYPLGDPVYIQVLKKVKH